MFCVNGLRLTFYISVSLIIKCIYTPCRCLIFIYICVSVNVKYEMCKCKNKYIYMILHDHVKQCKKCDFYLGRGDFIMFLVIGQPSGPLQRKNPSKHAPITN